MRRDLDLSHGFARSMETMAAARNRRSYNGVYFLFMAVKVCQLTGEKLMIP